MFELYQNGAFGNKLRTWDNIHEFYASDYQGLVTLRYKGGVAGGLAYYEIPRWDLPRIIDELRNKGTNVNLITVNESAPDSRLTIQGEIQQDEYGLSVFWSDKKAKMRVALQEGKQTRGIRAHFLLQKYLSPASYDDVNELSECYFGAVIEFSAYEMNLGCFRGRNTIIWECRHY